MVLFSDCGEEKVVSLLSEFLEKESKQVLAKSEPESIFEGLKKKI